MVWSIKEGRSSNEDRSGCAINELLSPSYESAVNDWSICPLHVDVYNAIVYEKRIADHDILGGQKVEHASTPILWR